MLDFRIDTFLAACECLNFTRTAALLHITQPAVSQHIRFLEKEYGTRLFEMTGKKMKLTPQGELLRSAMQRMKNDERRLHEILNRAGDGSRILSFGVTMTIGEYAVTEPLAGFTARYPERNVHVRYGNTAELLQALHRGEIDFALVEGYFAEDHYETEVMRTERFTGVCSSGHQFVREPSRLRDLFDERLIVREPGSGTREILERNLAVQNSNISDFRHFIEVENMHTITQLLEKDVGITFLYRTAVEKEIDAGILKEIRLEDFHVEHDFTFIWEKNSIFSGENRRICRELKLLQ